MFSLLIISKGSVFLLYLKVASIFVHKSSGRKNDKVQWKLGITRSLGPRNFACYISSQKTTQNKESIVIGTGEISLLHQVFCYIRSLYIEFPLYTAMLKKLT